MTDTPSIRRHLVAQAEPEKGTKLVPILVALDWANLPYHRLANEYPMADEHEQAAITESIKANGFFQDEPIILFREDGKADISEFRPWKTPIRPFANRDRKRLENI